MNASRQTTARGKWVAAIVVILGVAAALAEWKFRPPTLAPDPIPTTAPALQE